MKKHISSIPSDIDQIVSLALAEDIGSGDITAQLIPADSIASAKVITRQECIVAGTEDKAGSQVLAAELLGLNRTMLSKKMRLYYRD